MEIPLAVIIGAVILAVFFLLRIAYRACFRRFFDDCWLCDEGKSTKHRPSSNDYLKVKVETLVEINGQTKKSQSICDRPLLYFSEESQSVLLPWKKSTVAVPLVSSNRPEPGKHLRSTYKPLAAVATSASLKPGYCSSKLRANETDNLRIFSLAATQSEGIPQPNCDPLESGRPPSLSTTTSEPLNDRKSASSSCDQELNRRIISWLATTPSTKAECYWPPLDMLVNIRDLNSNEKPDLRCSSVNYRTSCGLPERQEKLFDYVRSSARVKESSVETV